MPGTFFGWDVAILKTVSAGYDFLDIFTDCELTTEVETDRSRAAQDLNDTIANGFDCDVQKSRSWSMRIGAAVDQIATGGAESCRRAFGWDMITLSVGGTPVLDLFTSARVRISNETVSARAVMDTVTSPYFGWQYPHLGHRSMEIEIEGVVNLTTLFDMSLSGWGPTTGVVAYSMAGGGLTLAGSGVLAGGALRIPAEGASQSIRLMAHGPPTTGPTMPNDPGKFLEMAVANTVWQLQMTHPNVSNSVYQGSAVLTEATFDAPDGACLQGATFSGVGPLFITTPA